MTQPAIESPVPAAPPAPVSVPVRERGWAAETLNPVGWWSTLAEERVPELQWPASLDVYDEMMNDPQVSSVLNAVMSPILRTTWRLDGSGCREEVVTHCAEDLGLPIVGEGSSPTGDDSAEDRFSWSEHMETALEEFLGYGHSYFEQLAVMGDDGRWHLRKLGWRPPRSIKQFVTARDGGLVAVVQKPPAGNIISVRGASTGEVTLPVARIVAYVHRRKGANWVGRSLLRPAYQPWLLNNRAKRVEMIVVERQGAPVVTYIGAEKETDLAAGQKIAREVRAGETAGAAIPYGAQLKQEGVTGQLPDIGKIKSYNDDLTARAVLAHVLNLGSSSNSSSYALGSTLADVLATAVTAKAEVFRRTGSQHVVRDIVTWNWGPRERAPRLVFDEIGSKQQSIVIAIAQLTQAGVLQPDESLENFIRTTLGLPPRAAGSPTTAPEETP